LGSCKIRRCKAIREGKLKQLKLSEAERDYYLEEDILLLEILFQ
jgi:hypothetical protein